MQSIAIKTISKKLIGYLLTSILLPIALISCANIQSKKQDSETYNKDYYKQNENQTKTIKEYEKSSKPNFELKFTAVKTAREALQNSLDIVEYQYIENLSNDDLNQLIFQIPHNAEKILALYGYFNPIVTVEKSIQNNGIPLISITVVVGLRNRVNNVELELSGDIVFDTSPEIIKFRRKLYDSWLLHSPRFFTQKRWNDAKNELLKIMVSNYYPDAKLVQSQAKVHAKENKTDILVRYDSGSRYQIGNINIHGLQRYSENLVKNIMQIKEGQPYLYQIIIDAQTNLTNSSYFDSANLYLDTENATLAADNKTKIANLEVNLTEHKLKHTITSIGITTNSGPRLGIEFGHNKLPFYNLRNNIKLELNKNNYKANIDFITPINKNNWAWILSDKFQYEKLLDFKFSKHNEISLGRIKQTNQHDNGFYLTHTKSLNKKSNDELIKASSISLKHKFVLRNFDNYLNPKEGWATSIDYGIGLSKYNSKEYPFFRLDTRLLKFFQILNTNSRILLNSEIGAVVANNNAVLPSSELFSAGGINSIRGYSYRSLGILNQEDNKHYPAKNIYSLNIEWQKPIFIDNIYTGFDGIIFVDSVNLSDKFKFNKQWYNGVGIGVIWANPVGSLQINLARAIQQKKFRFHLSLGYAF